MSAEHTRTDDDDDSDGVAAAAPRFTLEPLLPWHEAPLREWLGQSAGWHHATLLHGPAGSGARRLALHLAQALLCQTPADGIACGRCAACHLFTIGGHPDFRLVEREFDEKSLRTNEPRLRDAIVIDQVRALIDRFLYLTSHLQGAKVVLIHLAEALNVAAANALLKSLEEPPPATYFLLASQQPRRLPPTIISRCRLLPVPQPAAAAAMAWLAEQGADDPPVLLAQAGGMPLRALTMLDASYQAERKRFLQRLADPRRLPVVALGADVESGPRALRKERLQHWFDLLATWTYDLAACAQGLAPRYHPDFAQQLAALAATVAPRSVLRYHRTLLTERTLLSHPLNPRLVAENALYGYREAVAGK
jgi:DNA polymerase-3 subunit delta'